MYTFHAVVDQYWVLTQNVQTAQSERWKRDHCLRNHHRHDPTDIQTHLHTEILTQFLLPM